MKLLAPIYDNALAQHVLWALNEQGVKAELTSEHPVQSLYSGQLQFNIWIADDADVEKAMRIHDDVLASQTVKECPHCQYDLQGHRGRANCPECGRAITAPQEDQQCSACGETSPANFEVCWNCGSAFGEERSE